MDFVVLKSLGSLNNGSRYRWSRRTGIDIDEERTVNNDNHVPTYQPPCEDETPLDSGRNRRLLFIELK